MEESVFVGVASGGNMIVFIDGLRSTTSSISLLLLLSRFVGLIRRLRNFSRKPGCMVIRGDEGSTIGSSGGWTVAGCEEGLAMIEKSSGGWTVASTLVEFPLFSPGNFWDVRGPNPIPGLAETTE